MHRRRQAELLGGQDLGRDLAEDRRVPAPVLEHVAAEARDARDLVGEVGVVAESVNSLRFRSGMIGPEQLHDVEAAVSTERPPRSSAIVWQSSRSHRNEPNKRCRSEAPLATIAWITSGASLTGFTLTNGVTYVGNGGGVFCTSTNAFLTNCVIRGSMAYVAFGSGGYGGGAYGGTLYNCTLSGNSADAGGGASACTLYNCTLSGNSAEVRRRGVCAARSTTAR